MSRFLWFSVYIYTPHHLRKKEVVSAQINLNVIILFAIISHVKMDEF